MMKSLSVKTVWGSLILVLVALLLMSAPSVAFACTGIYVGKDVSEDGSVMFGRSEDIGSNYVKTFEIHEGQTYTEGEMFVDSIGFSMPYPTLTYTYSAVEDSAEAGEGDRAFGEAGTNEFGLGITATVSATPNETVQEADPFVETGISELSMAEVVLMQAQTPREAVEVLAEIIDTYGAAEGNIVMIGNETEVWYMEILSGHQYVAIKLPDDVAFVVPNAYMLKTVDVASSDVIASEGLISMPEENGFLVEEDGLINISETYSYPLDEYNVYRAWGGLYLLTGIDYSLEEVDEMDRMVTPTEKISLSDVQEILSYRYEGTAYDADLPENEGIRVIGTSKQAEAHILTYEDGVDSVIGGVFWLAMANTEYSVFLPFYTSLMTDTPEVYQVETLDYNDESAYWKTRSIGVLCATNREYYGAGVSDYYDTYQQAIIEAQEEIAPQMQELYEQDFQEASSLATDLAVSLAEEHFGHLDVIYSELMTFVAEYEEYGPDEVFVTSLSQDEVVSEYSFDMVDLTENSTSSQDILEDDSTDESDASEDAGNVVWFACAGAVLVALVLWWVRKSRKES